MRKCKVTDEQLLEEVKKLGMKAYTERIIAKKYSASESWIYAKLRKLGLRKPHGLPNEIERSIQNYKLNIPRQYLRSLGIDVNELVSVKCESDRIIISKITGGQIYENNN